MSIKYPTCLSDVGAWSKENGVAVVEGRIRLAQYAVLRAVASSRLLSDILVFKGGNALDFVWQPNRSTRDLDFSVDMEIMGERGYSANFETVLETSFTPSLNSVRADIGIVFRVHGVDRQPPGADKTFVTYTARIGYALPDQISLLARMANAQKSKQVIPVEVSINEPICADQRVDVQATNALRVCTLEDIVAEKLRALLQQPLRKRQRPQDLLDIALLLTTHPDLDRPRIADFLQRKAAARFVPVARSAFRDPEVLQRARVDYDALEITTRKLFISYDDACAILLAFTDTLPIPEHSL